MMWRAIRILLYARQWAASSAHALLHQHLSHARGTWVMPEMTTRVLNSTLKLEL